MKIGFIGAGRMAEALFSALLDASVCSPSDLLVSDISAERCESLSRQYGIGVTEGNVDVVAGSTIVFLAVKPQDLDDVLAGIVDDSKGKLLVSIAAGKKLSYFESRLPESRFVRVMPNLACQVGEGMSAYCGGCGVSDHDLDTVKCMLECTGKALSIPESQFDTVTALSGSGPAFFAYVIRALVEGAVQDGLGEDAALMLAEQTMLGTAKVLQEGGDSPDIFMDKVASKGGTTAAGLEVLENSSVEVDFGRTLKATADRSREMSG
jgi:pyrroline-5-carboxylate reductase